MKIDRDQKIVLAAVLGAVLILLAFATVNSPEQASNTDSGDFNDADTMFMSMMIVHHDQAIEMAELAENRTDNENILELAENISQAQTQENRQMAEWLRELGYGRPENGHRMAGMASEQNMTRLEESNGSEFDQLFAELMITHHRGGVLMAQSFVDRGLNPELKEMEKDMIEAQKREIELMNDWRKNWSS